MVNIMHVRTFLEKCSGDIAKNESQQHPPCHGSDELPPT
jgi:hypothetical protein